MDLTSFLQKIQENSLPREKIKDGWHKMFIAYADTGEFFNYFTKQFEQLGFFVFADKNDVDGNIVAVKRPIRFGQKAWFRKFLNVLNITDDAIKQGKITIEGKYLNVLTKDGYFVDISPYISEKEEVVEKIDEGLIERCKKLMAYIQQKEKEKFVGQSQG